MISKLIDKLEDNSLKLLCLLVFSSTLIIYLFTLNSHVILGDTGEFIAASYELGIPHPPGYPLFTLIGHLFTKLPFGNVIQRVGLASAIFGSLTSLGVFIILYRMTSSKISSLVGSLTLSFSFIFWIYSVNAEIITLNTLFLISLFFLAYIFKKTKNIKFLYFLSFTFGLSLTNQYSVVTVLPAILFLIFKDRAQIFRIRPLLILVAAFFLGLLPYIYIPLASSMGPYVNWNNPSTLEGFISLITRKNYGVLTVGDYQGGNLLDILTNQIPFYFYDIFKSFGFIAAFLFIVGLLPTKKSHTFWALLITLFFTGPFLVGYTNFTLGSPFPDVAINQKRTMETVYVISAPFIAIFVGLGIHRLTQFSKKIKLVKKRVFVSLIGILAFLVPLISNYPKVAKANNNLFNFYGRQILNSLPENSFLITGADNTYIFWYLQVVENLKTDIPIVNFSMMQNRSYVDQQKRRLQLINFPFDHITVGETLNDFYDINLPSWHIYFAPFDDQSERSIPENYKVIPEGLTVKLIKKEDSLDIEEYKKRQDEFWREIENNPKIFLDYKDLPTQEIQTAYARSWTNIGIVYENHEKDEWAIEAYKRARLITPRYYLSTQQLADLYIQRGGDYWGKAIELYLDILTYNPKHTDSYKNIGVLYYEKRKFGKSKKYLEEHFKLSTNKEISPQLRNIYELVKNY